MSNPYIEEAEDAILHTYNRYQIVLDKGEGVHLYDINGKEYLDGIDLFPDEFYKFLEEDADVSTSQPSPDSVMKLWDELLKEYDEIAAVNKKNGDFHSADEFLSGFKKTDRLHPVISLCVYYGESEWDGPFSLKDMLEIPEKIEPLVSDYRMNLVQVRSSGELCFSDPDVNMVFDMSRLIYARDYAKIKEVYSDHDIPADLGVVIGAITESQKLINHALELEQRGRKINMCNALEELRQEGVEEGRQEGRREGRWEGILEGIRATVRTCRNFNISETDTVRNIMNEFSLSQEEAVNYVKKYW